MYSRKSNWHYQVMTFLFPCPCQCTECVFENLEQFLQNHTMLTSHVLCSVLYPLMTLSCERCLTLLLSGTRSSLMRRLVPQSLASSSSAISCRWKTATCAERRRTLPLGVRSKSSTVSVTSDAGAATVALAPADPAAADAAVAPVVVVVVVVVDVDDDSGGGCSCSSCSLLRSSGLSFTRAGCCCCWWWCGLLCTSSLCFSVGSCSFLLACLDSSVLT